MAIPEVNVAARLRQWRQRRGLTTIQLADRLDVHQSTISRLENGKRRLDAEMLVELCRALNITPSMLFEEKNEEDAAFELAQYLSSDEKREVRNFILFKLSQNGRELRPHQTRDEPQDFRTANDLVAAASC